MSEISSYQAVQSELRSHPQHFLVTGAAGFIGSHLVESLLKLGQSVRAIDDFSTGSVQNLRDVEAKVGPEAWSRFELIEADISVFDQLDEALQGCDYVLHQAALGSVPRSIAHPVRSHAVNVEGFLRLLEACRKHPPKRLVYASSSSVYGDHPALPKREAETGRVLSPYAATKVNNELYAGVWSHTYGLPSVGLRYFNVTGPRQSPAGAYAAVIPRWIEALIHGQRATIFGDGETSRDFCPIDLVVQANLLAALRGGDGHAVFNIAVGEQTTLNQLHQILCDELASRGAPCAGLQPIYEDFRPGDVRHSLADVSAAREQLGYETTTSLRDSLVRTLDWAWSRAQDS